MSVHRRISDAPLARREGRFMTQVGHSGSFSELAGRAKNYLFIGSEGAAKAAAIAYTLIETTKVNGVDPQARLTDVLNRACRWT